MDNVIACGFRPADRPICYRLPVGSRHPFLVINPTAGFRRVLTVTALGDVLRVGDRTTG